MYGQPEIPRPTQLKQADEAFVVNAASEFGGDRRLAAIAWTDQADRYFAEGNLDLAMRRYNQAWLLDPTSYEVFLGFGRVMLAQQRYDSAVAQLRRSLQLCDEAAALPAILSDLGVAYSRQADAIKGLPSTRAATFALANESFAGSTSNAPDNPETWRRWARSLSAEGKPADAAEKLRRADAAARAR